jgi:hypothetical protein
VFQGAQGGGGGFGLQRDPCFQQVLSTVAGPVAARASGAAGLVRGELELVDAVDGVFQVPVVQGEVGGADEDVGFAVRVGGGERLAGEVEGGKGFGEGVDRGFDPWVWGEDGDAVGEEAGDADEDLGG